MAEKKLFQLVLVSLLAYGFVSFFQFGVFLVPLPIFEMVILGVSVYFGMLNFSTNKTLTFLFVFYGLLQFLGREYNYAFFLSDENLLALSSSVFVDFILLINSIIVFFLFVVQNRKDFEPRWLLLTTAVSLSLSLLLPYQWFIVFPLIAATVWFVLHKNLFEKQHSFWLILLVFCLSRELTLILL